MKELDLSPTPLQLECERLRLELGANARLFLDDIARIERDRDSLIADQKIQLGKIADLQRYQRDYNELRKVIDNGSESATHASALYKVCLLYTSPSPRD